jgi:hypothetical protein
MAPERPSVAYGLFARFAFVSVLAGMVVASLGLGMMGIFDGADPSLVLQAVVITPIYASPFGAVVLAMALTLGYALWRIAVMAGVPTWLCIALQGALASATLVIVYFVPLYLMTGNFNIEGRPVFPGLGSPKWFAVQFGIVFAATLPTTLLIGRRFYGGGRGGDGA